MNRIGDYTISFKDPPKWRAGYSVVGPKEGKGPITRYFDYILK